uniref:Methyltransferase small domain-containing protein n=1 Tax=Solanum lycopersicum TaxID=4081 RepID=A0A3Q7FEN6_SOLLC
MALSFFSPPAPPVHRITCQALSVAVPSVAVAVAPLPVNPNPSLSCALNCTHFQSCSGCTQEYNLHHPVVIDEAIGFFNKLGIKDFSFDSCRLWGWRCRAKLAVRGSSTNPLIGLYEEGTHNVVDIPDCKSHHPNINAAVKLLKKGLFLILLPIHVNELYILFLLLIWIFHPGIIELNVEPYDEDQGTGDLRYVQMAVTTHDTSLPIPERYKNGKVQVSLVWNSRSENSANTAKLNALANIIFGNRWRHLLGERDFWEHIGGIDVSLAPSSFGQANTRAFDSLLRKLQKYVPQGASVVDLYAGAGVIGLSLAVSRRCRSVKCVEVNKESRQSFEKTVERLPTNVESNISWHHADASIEPTSWLLGSDVVVVDPPRKGLDPSLVKELRHISAVELRTFKRWSEGNSMKPEKVKDEKRPWILRAREDSIQIESTTVHEENQSLPQTLIYISCGWESFKEDCSSLLASKEWHLHKAHGFNFFPGTQSIEILAVFKRGRGASTKKKKSGKKQKKPH